ncbi:conserved hypothetical protein [Haliangium ochraceum DSM 14365]|uniref:Uncharacterized protein n=2 Tax=Haliangium ochraceum TaxID=80816 RepID=D0LQK5_HALO1|nr:conserved hypothetical protein [Haliangium ochraceum DSM 14365]
MAASEKPMSLQRIKRNLEREVFTDGNQQRFALAKTRNRALQPYDSLAALLAAFDDAAPLSYTDKEAILQALLREHRSGAASLWSAVLVLAFYPMLSGLSRRIRCDVLRRDDLCQMLLEAFLEAVHSAPVAGGRNRTFSYLRLATKRSVFASLRRMQREAQAVQCEAPAPLAQCGERLDGDGRGRLWPDIRPESTDVLDEDALGSLSCFLVEHAGQELDDEKLELIVATTVRGERLGTYVHRRYPSLPPQQRQSIYERVKRQHSRTLAGLRLALSHVHAQLSAGETALYAA